MPTIATTSGDYPSWEPGFCTETATASPIVAITASTWASTPATSRPSPSTSSPKYSANQTNSAPRGLPRDVVGPRRPSLVRFHHRARTGLTTAGSRGPPYRTNCPHPGPLFDFIVISIDYRHFMIYAGDAPPDRPKPRQ